MLTTQDHSSIRNVGFETPEIRYNTDAVTIEAQYSDELSAHRAKRIWIETLQSHFLLEEASDYLMAITADEDSEALSFSLRCFFSSACARYAFWRMTNNQAPEAQYVFETAHIPLTSDSWLSFQTSGDLREIASQVDDNPLSVDLQTKQVHVNSNWFNKFEEMLDRLVSSFDATPKK